MEKTAEGRVRMNLSQSAKGAWQIDCTAEFPTVAECKKQLDEAIKAAKLIIADNGLKEVKE